MTLLGPGKLTKRAFRFCSNLTARKNSHRFSPCFLLLFSSSVESTVLLYYCLITFPFTLQMSSSRLLTHLCRLFSTRSIISSALHSSSKQVSTSVTSRTFSHSSSSSSSSCCSSVRSFSSSSSSSSTSSRPFRILGIQQIAIGGESKQKLGNLWTEIFG